MPHGLFSGTLSFKVLAVNMHYWLFGSNHWWVGFPCSDHGATSIYKPLVEGDCLFMEVFNFVMNKRSLLGQLFRVQAPFWGVLTLDHGNRRSHMSLITVNLLKHSVSSTFWHLVLFCHTLNLNHHNPHAEAAQEVWNLKLAVKRTCGVLKALSLFTGRLYQNTEKHWLPCWRVNLFASTLYHSESLS